MNTKRVHMRKRSPHDLDVSSGHARRRGHRLRIWEALHGICLKIERLQPTQAARLACREVARAISEARAKEAGRGKSKEH